MFNSYYLILLAKPLQSQNKTSDFNVDFNTDGWIYLIHDVDDNPALHIYYGHFLNPSSGLDTSLELTKVRSRKQATCYSVAFIPSQRNIEPT